MTREAEYKNNNFSKIASKGFTLIELVMVIAIVTIMSSVVAFSLTSTRGESKLNAAQRELAANVKLAQSYALQGKLWNDEVPDYYGLKFFDSRNYGICACSDDNCDDCNNPNGSNVLEQYAFADNNVTKSGNNQMVFSVPHGRATSGAAFTLRIGGVSITKIVSVTPGGFITEN